MFKLTAHEPGASSKEGEFLRPGEDPSFEGGESPFRNSIGLFGIDYALKSFG